MPTSEARVAANRRNSLLSTGPRTPEGKASSRRNGLKHGLSGEGIVLSTEDAEEVELRDSELQAELNPQTRMGQILVRRIATLSVRMERGAQQEFAAIASRVRLAADDFDQDRLDEADRLFSRLPDDPRANLRKLRRSPEGVDRLLLAWRELRDDLTQDGKPLWTPEHRQLAEHLTGRRVVEGRETEIGTLSRPILGDFSDFGDIKGRDREVAELVVLARADLIKRIAAEIADLEDHRETLDFEAIELDRAQAGTRALFDDSKQATRARRYESEASRGFFKALKELREVEAQAAEEKAASAKPDPKTSCDPLASSWDRPAASPREPRPTPRAGHPTSDRPFPGSENRSEAVAEPCFGSA